MMTVKVVILLLVCLQLACATLWLPGVYSTNMVLQRTTQNCFSGTATPNMMVHMNITNAQSVLLAAYQTTANSDGTFEICIPQSLYTKCGYTPFTIDVYDNNSNKVYYNVIYGEVWLCSGQSNMQFSAFGAFDFAELTTGPQPSIMRAIGVNDGWNATLQDDIGGWWSVMDSSNAISWLSAVCYAFGRELVNETGVPVGLIDSSVGGTSIQSWSTQASLTKCGYPIAPPTGDHAPLTLFNGMIYPFRRLSIAGFLWYQGEADAYIPNAYECWFPNMITDWRTLFKIPNAPFGFVQLSAWNITEGVFTQYDVQRYAQAASTMGMSNVYHTTGIDLGDPVSPYGSIHSRNKTLVGQRLFRMIGADLYNTKATPTTGPANPSCCYNINAATNTQTYKVSFSNANSLTQISTPSCDMVPNPFTSCCQNGPFDTISAKGVQMNFDSTSYSGNTAILTMNMSRLAAAGNFTVYNVRHAAANYPQCVLYNAADPALLPAYGFNITCSTVCPPPTQPPTTHAPTVAPTAPAPTHTATASPASTGSVSTTSPSDNTNSGGVLVYNAAMLIVVCVAGVLISMMA